MLFTYPPPVHRDAGVIQRITAENGTYTESWLREPSRFVQVDAHLLIDGGYVSPPVIQDGTRFILLGIPFIVCHLELPYTICWCVRTDLRFTPAALAFDRLCRSLTDAERWLYRVLLRCRVIVHPDRGAQGEWRNLRGFGWLKRRLNARRDARLQAWLATWNTKVRQSIERASA